MPTATIVNADCLDALAEIESGTVDAIITDPPYGLANTRPAQVADTLARWVAGDRAHLPAGRGFMGYEWDGFVPPPAIWDECLRVLKPGGHLLVFAGSRTVDLMGLAIRLAGFDIRDQIQWLYGSGFPKSMDVGKAIDKAAGAERESLGPGPYANRGRRADNRVYRPSTPSSAEVITAPATPEAERWQGWGTALKPAHEPIILARKPLAGTVAANVLAHGTGALNIDGCRIGTGGQLKWERPRNMGYYGGTDSGPAPAMTSPVGRWPANVVFDEEAAAILDEQSGVTTSRRADRGKGKGATPVRGHDDQGGASRFFYVAKAGKSERPNVEGVQHPTVKPVALMRWLVRLVTPPGGLVLDPFAGSGTTGEAALAEGIDAVLIERAPEYVALIEARLDRARKATA